MCGIWALIQNDKITKSDIKNYLTQFNSIKSRGPDKSTLYYNGSTAFGFHRLAIHDLSPLGDQPFIWHNNNKMYILIVNGEIYNYKELIDKYNLETYSDSDCEVIYHLYKLFGSAKQVALELKGEYVFILTEIQDDNFTTYICRDPFGVRPLFYSYNSITNRYLFGSLLSGVIDNDVVGHVFPPGQILTLKNNSDSWSSYYKYSFPIKYTFIKDQSKQITTIWDQYYYYEYPIKYNVELKTLYKEITDRLINAVKIRLDSERPVGALLSGGLDSSLVCGIITKVLGYNNLSTFSIGMKKGTDLEYAQKVANHLGTNHTEVFFTPEEGLKAIDNVLAVTETWDITTVRASVGQYLLGKYISKNTDIKVILNGDGADEVEMGYLYFYLAPDKDQAQQETIKLLNEIHRYDGLRVDRCISTHGLEARIPFLDTDFVDYYMSIDPELKIPTSSRMEKQLIRDAFNALYPDILPYEVLYRKKEAFSDGISSKEKSWFEIITEWIDTKISDEEYNERDTKKYGECRSKESYYYRETFDKHFNGSRESCTVIPKYWLPNWVETNGEPSARVLMVYK